MAAARCRCPAARVSYPGSWLAVDPGVGQLAVEQGARLGAWFAVHQPQPAPGQVPDRSACWARPARPSPPPTCSTTWWSTPGALYRYRRQHQTGGWLALTLVAGTLPGVIAGSVIRVELVPGARVFDLMVVRAPAAAGDLAGRHPARPRPRPGRPSPPDIPVPVLVALGVGDRLRGRHLRDRRRRDLSPVLIGSGRPASEVAPATLASTFVTSLGGVLAFTLLSLRHAPVAPNWPTASRWASAASPAATPGPGSSTGFPASLSAASSAAWPSPSRPGTCGPG